MSVSTSRKDSTTTVYKKDVDRKTREMLHPSSSMFAHREVCIKVGLLPSGYGPFLFYIYFFFTKNLKSREM